MLKVNMNTKITLAVVAIVSALALVIAPSLMTTASAKITPKTTDTSCTNGGGQQPGGQQPTCQGSGLTQQQTTENVNPSGSAPPGQNK
jgi:hypothetical protein